MGDEEYLQLLQSELAELVKGFRPDIVFYQAAPTPSVLLSSSPSSSPSPLLRHLDPHLLPHFFPHPAQPDFVTVRCWLVPY